VTRSRAAGHWRQTRGARARAPHGGQTFSGSDAERFLSSAGTGRPWPNPWRLGRADAAVVDVPEAASLADGATLG
jgi:hypothetical protein